MSEVAIRELRNHTRQVIERVEAGEAITVTVDGRPAAELRALHTRPRFVDRRRFLAMLEGQRADPGLRDDLATLVPDTTDDLPS